MLVMPVATVLALQKLMPHQEMLRKKLLLPYNQKTMAGRVIFVSHQVRQRPRGSRRFEFRVPRLQVVPGVEPITEGRRVGSIINDGPSTSHSLSALASSPPSSFRPYLYGKVP